MERTLLKGSELNFISRFGVSQTIYLVWLPDLRHYMSLVMIKLNISEYLLPVFGRMVVAVYAL